MNAAIKKLNRPISKFLNHCINPKLPPAFRCAALDWRAAGPATQLVAILAGVFLLPQMILAGNLYWDTNGATSGAGGATPSGIWDTGTANWSTSSAGNIATTIWSDGSGAIFSAGSDATGNYTITVSGTQSPTNITFATGTATLAGGGLALSGAGTVAVNSTAKGIIGSAVSGSVGLNKQNSGELVLTAANTFSGDLTLTAGTLTLNNSAAASSGSIIFNPSGANTLVLTSSNAAINLANNISLGSGVGGSVYVNPGAANTLTLSGILSGTHQWVENGSGTLKLSGSSANTFSGLFTINSGTVVATAAGALGSPTGSGVLVNSGATLALDGGVTVTAPLTLKGAGVGNNGALQSLTGLNYFGGVIALTADTTVGALASSTLVLNNTVSGAYDLAVTGGGTVALESSPNNYNNTLVAAGTLEVDGSANAGNGLVTVDAGATLTGSGSAPGGVSLSGTIAPIGTFVTGPQTWNGGGEYVWGIANASNPAYNDLLTNSSSLTISAITTPKFTISILSLDPNTFDPGPAGNFDNTQQYQWTIVRTTTGITGFNPSKFTIDDSAFISQQSLGGGSFRLLVSGNNLVLEFDPAPVITCPAPIVQANDNGLCSATVSFAAVATNYPNLSPVTIAYQTNGVPITSPCVFGKGTTLVTATATDAVNDTATCSFSVTVNDTQAPTIIAPADLADVPTDPGQCSTALANVSLGVPVTGDNCGGILVVSSNAPSVFPKGTTPVTWTVTDTSGNQNTAIQNVTVKDHQAPSANVPANIVQNNDPGQCGAVVTFSLPAQTDNCGVAGQVATPASGSFFPTGPNTVTVVVTDTSANKATNTFTVTILDNQPPTIQAGVAAVVPGATLHVANTMNGVIGQFSLTGEASLFADTGSYGLFSLALDTAGNLFATDLSDNTIKKFTPAGAMSVFATGLNVPFGLAFDTAGNLYVANFGGTTVQKFTPGGVGSVFASGLSSPTGLSFDHAGNLYVAELIAGTITKFTPGGAGSVFATGLSHPTGLAFDHAGNLYVANNTAQTIQRFSPVGTNLGIFASTGNNAPYRLAFDSAGNLFVSSGNNDIIEEFTPGGVGSIFAVANLTNNLDRPAGLAFVPSVLTNAVVSTDPGQCSAVVSYSVVPNDNCGVATVMQTTGLPSGSAFPPGTTTNTFVVTDTSGNTATNSFTITVNDTTPPAVVFNPITVQLDASGNYTLTPTDVANIAAGSSDSCGIASTSVSPSSFTFCDVGSKLVALTVTDVYGNQSTSNATITVNAPVAPPAVVYVDANYPGSCGPVPFPFTGGTGNYYIGYNAFATIQAAIAAVASGGTVNVAPGTYTGNLALGQPVTLQSSGGASQTTIAGAGADAIDINSDNVTVRGFTVSNPTGLNGIVAANHSGLVIADNQVQDIGLNATSADNHAGISVSSFSAVAVANIQITGNVVSNIVNTPITAKSAQAIVVGYSGGTANITGLIIASNKIAAVASPRGAYGIQLNHTTSPVGGQTVAPQIFDNQISGLNGLWAHAIALEGNTPNVLVSGNLISNIIASNPDSVGVQVEDNAFASSVTIVNNSFTGVLLGVQNVTGAPVSAVSNWWGAVNGPSNPANVVGTGVQASANVIFSPWLGDGTDTSPAVGFQPYPSPVYYSPASLTLAVQPVGAALGVALSTQPMVNVLDGNNALATQYYGPVTVALAANPGGGLLIGTLTVNAIAGVATFTDLAVTVGGGSGYTLVASAPGLSSAISSPFDIGNPLPVLTSLNPAGAVTGSGGGNVSVAVSGNNFVPASVVLADGSPVTTVYGSASTLTATLSTASTATYSIAVSNPPASGGVSGSLNFVVNTTPNDVYVDGGYGPGNSGSHAWGYDAFATIANGIAAAAAGGNVHVAAGTFNEAVVVNKSLSLLGADSGSACGGSGSSVINAGAGTAVTVAANNVTVDGFALQGATGLSDTGYTGLVAQNNKVTAVAVGLSLQGIAGAFTVRDNCVTLAGQLAGSTPTIGIVVAGASGAAATTVSGNQVAGAFYGYLLYAVNSTPAVAVQGGSITGAVQAVAVVNTVDFANYLPSTFTVDGVTASGFAGSYPNAPQAGVYVYTGGSSPLAAVSGTVTNVTITGVGKVSADSAGIDLADFSTGTGVRQQVTVLNSTISTNSNRGIFVSGSNAVATVSGCSVIGNGFDPYGAGGNTGFGVIARNNAQLTVSQSFIANPATQINYSVTALDADASTSPLGPTLTVSDCSIVNNGNGQLAAQSAGTLNASGNWWGTTSDTAIAALTTGTVDFTPYLDSGTDTAPGTTGFQGDFHTLHVTPLGAQTGLITRIQEGINSVLVGGTVNVTAGTFTENILLNKQVSVVGAGSGGSDTVIATAAGDPASGLVQVSASGTLASPVLLKDVRVTPVGRAGISVGLFTQQTGTSVDYLTLDNVKVIGSNANPCTEQERGLYVDLTSSLQHLVINNCSFDNLHYGWYLQKKVDLADTSTVRYVQVTDTSISHNNLKGLYAEKLSDATFLRCTIQQNGYDTTIASSACSYFAPNMAGFDVNLKAGTYGNLVFDQCSFLNNALGGGAVNGVGLAVKARGTSAADSSYSANPATVASITVANCLFTGNESGVRFGEPGKDNTQPTGITIVNSGFSGNVNGGLAEVLGVTAPVVTAVSNWWGDISGPSGPANPYGTGDLISGNITFSPWLSAGDQDNGTIGFQPAPGVNYQPVQLAFATQPGNSGLGVSLPQQPVVAVEDVNNVVTPWAQPSVGVVIGNNPGGGVLTGTTSEPAVSGAATFTDLAVTVGGGSGYTLVASAPGLSSAISSPFDIGNPLPVLTSLNPAGAVTGSGGGNVSVAVSGNNFVPASVVLADGSPVTTVYGSASTLTATLSTASTATYSIAVSNPPASGGVSGSLNFVVNTTPNDVYVDGGYGPGNSGSHAWGYDAFATIANGIAAAAAGGNVHVAAGTFNEAVVVNKSLSLLGADSGSACGGSGSSVINAGAGTAVTVAANNVTVDGFALQGATGLSDTGYTGLVAQNNKVTAVAVGLSLQGIAGAFTVRDNCVTLAGQLAGSTPTIGIVVAGASGAAATTVSGNQVAGAFYGYLLYAVNSTPAVAVQGGSITGAVQAVAVVNTVDFANYLPSTFTVDGVTASGFAGSYPNAPQAGVYVYTGGSSPLAAVSGTVTNVTITGVGKVSADSAGIDLADFSTGTGVRQQVTVLNSTISTNSNRGIFVSGSNAVATVSGCSVIGNGFDPYGAGGNTGFGVIARNNAQLTVSQSFIANPATQINYSVTALDADASTSPLGPTLTVSDCSIVNNGNGQLAAQSAGTLNASGNWWGTTSDTAIAALTTGTVDFTPYLDSGTDTAPGTTGFQGDFHTLHVTPLGAQTGLITRIQEGINSVSGSTVIIEAGNYVENILANKDNLELAGVGQASVSIVPLLSGPNPGGGSLPAGASSIILVQANNVRIHDMTLDGNNPSITSGVLSGGVDVDARNGIIEDFNSGTFSGTEVFNTTVKNIYLRAIYASSGGTGFSFHDNTVQNVQGDPNGSLAIFNFGGSGIISNNVVSSAYDAIAANWSAGTIFANNTITGSGSGVHTDNSSGPDLLKGNQVSAMQADAYGVFVFAPYGSVTVDANTISGCDIGLALFGQGAATSPVFSNNSVTAGTGPDNIGVYETTSLLGYGFTDVSGVFQGNTVHNAIDAFYLEDTSGNNLMASITGNNILTGNGTAIYATGSGTKVKVENADLHNNSVAGISAINGAVVDAGACGLIDITGGLGSSTGGNDLTGYLVGGNAVINNTSTVRAYGNSFGATPLAPSIASAFTGIVPASQSGGLLVTPTLTGSTVQCAGEIPAAVNSLAGFLGLGGAVSATDGVLVNANDGPVTGPNAPYDGTVTRTYTLTDACGQSATSTQVFTVQDTTPPVVTVWPGNETLDVGGNCNVAVPDLTAGISASDNCGAVHYSQIPPVGTLVSLGTTNVLLTVTDDSSNATNHTVVLTIQDTSPAPAATFVDAAYTGLPSGTVVTFPNTGGTGPHYIGCDAFATVQAGIDRVASTGTVNVAAGSYVEDLTVEKSLALIGPNAANNPNTGPRVAEAVLIPATSDPDPYDNNSVTVLYISASGVTVKGFTVDGNNPGLTSGVLVGTVDVDAAEGIASYEGVSSITVANNIIKNTTYSGVDFYNYVNTAATTGNSITGNLFSNIGSTNFGFGFAVLIYNNFYVNVSSNVMSGVRIGVQTGNYSQANPGDAQYQSISDNTITCGSLGIFHNLAYSGASAFTMSNNVITAWAEPGFENYNREWDGILISSLQTSVSVLLINNTIDASASITNISGMKVGYNVWNTPTTGTVAISGGSVSGATYGAWVNNWDGYNSQGSSTHAAFNGVTISGGSLAGIYVQDDPRSANGSVVQATVAGNTVITGCATGMSVMGSNASANIHDNTASITGNGIGISVDTGKALLQNNDLTGNSVAGIWATNSAVVDAGNCTGVNVTGLGISTGGNNLSGYLTGPAKAIINANSGGTPVVLADHDNFGAVSTSDVIPDAFTGNVEYSQTPAVIAPPTSVLVTCSSQIPAGVTTLAAYQGIGGYFSANSPVTVSSSDSTNYANPPFTGSGVITRTYTVTDGCGVASTADQTITFSDTIPPVILTLPNVTYNADAGECSKSNVAWTVFASDDCALASVTSSPTNGATFDKGTTMVTVTATDTSGNITVTNFTVTINDTQPPVVTVWPADQTLDVGGNCNVAVPDLTAGISASDNCGAVHYSQIPPVGTLVSLGTTNVLLTVTDDSSNATNHTVVLTIQDTSPAPAATFVDAAYTGLPSGTVVTFPNTGGTGPHYIGCDAFATVQAGIDRVASTGTVNVAAGTYPEVAVVNKPLALLGAQAGQNSGARFAAFTTGVNGPKADPTVESVITAAATAPGSAPNDSIHIMADNVTVDGFVVDGNNPNLPQGSAIVVGGINTDSRRAIETEDAAGNFFSANSVTIKNNVIQNYAQRCIELVNPSDTSPATSGSLIAGNVIGNYGLDGILLAYNAYSDVISNVVNMAAGSEAGIWQQDSGFAAAPASIDWSHNTVMVCQDAFAGIWVNLFHSSPTTINIHDNTVNAAVGVTGDDDFTYGIYLTSIEGGTTPNLANNIVGASGGQFARGIALWNLPTTTPATISGGTVSNSLIGVSLSYDDANFNGAGVSFAANLSGVSVLGTGVGVLADATDSGSYTVQVEISGNSVINGCTTGISVLGSNASANVHDNTASITGNGTGISVDTGKALLENNDLTGNTVAAISASNNAIVDAGNCTGVNVTGLGLSTGGNNLSGYLTGPAKAIINANAGGTPVVLADHDNFGAGSGDNILNAFTGTVDYSQTPAVVTAPANISLVCVSSVPAGATSLADFTAQGGYYSGSSATVGYNDNPAYPYFAGSGVITRTYTVTDGCGVATTASQTINVSDTIPPVVTVSPNIVQGVDIGQNYATVTFNNTAVDNCDPNPSVVANPPSGSQFPVGTNTVMVVATDASGNSTTTNFTVAVIGLPDIITPPSSVTKNAGQTATFTVVASSPATLSYQWFKGVNALSDVGNISGSTTAVLTIANVQDGDVADYTVQVGNLAGNVTSSPAAHLTVIDAPVLASLTPVSQTNGATSTASFTVSLTGSGTPPFSYQWTKITATATNVLTDGGNITGATSNELTIANVLGADQATYSVTASNPAGTVTTNGTLVVIDPYITLQPVSVTNSLGSSVSFSVTAVGTQPLSYQWFQDNYELPGETSSTLAINSLVDSDEGDYTVVVSNSVGEAESEVATLTLTHPPVITIGPVSQTVNAGATVLFTVSANGTTPFHYQWRTNGVDLAGANGYQLVLSGVTPANEAGYQVVITNVDGSVTSTPPAILTVIVAPAIVTGPVGVTTNAGSAVSFSVTTTGTAPAYQWYQVTATSTNALSDGGNVTGAIGSLLTLASVLGADGAKYVVVASNQAGTATSSAATLVVIDPVITVQPLSQTVNAGSTAMFTVSAIGTTPGYQWYKGVAPIPLATGASLTLANVTAVDAAVYHVVVSNAYGVVTSSNASLTVIEPPVIVTQPLSRTNNAGETATFTVGYTGTAPAFQWYTNGAVLGGATGATLVLNNVSQADAVDYTVVLSNAAGSATSAPPAHLTVIDGPVITVQPLSRTNNASTTATFTVNVSGTAPFGYQWTKVTPTATNALSDAGNVSGSGSGTLTIANVLAADQASYFVTVTNPAGAVVSSNAQLVVNDPAVLVPPANATNFVGGTVTFNVTAAGTATLGYQWQFNGSALFGQTGSSLVLNAIANSDAGNYSVVVTNSVGSVTSAPALLVIISPLIVSNPTNLTVIQGQPASFSVGVNGQTPFTYQWQLNSNSLAGATNRILTIAAATNSVDAGYYRVIVSNPQGTQTSSNALLTVVVPPAITQQPTNAIAGTGQTVQFHVTATGTPLNYQWYSNNVSLGGATGATLTLNNVTTNSSGTYSVTVSNLGGLVTSSNATLAVYPLAPVVTAVSYEVTATNSQFTLTLTGVPTFPYAILGSSNLVDWVSLVTNAAPYTYVDVDTNGVANRFYRGRYQP